MSPLVRRSLWLAATAATLVAGLWFAHGVRDAVRDERGPNRLDVPMRVERVAIAELFYDIGAGTRQEDSARVVVAPSPAGGALRMASFEVPRTAVKGLRLDPIAFAGRFAIGAPRWTTATGRVLAQVPLEAVKPQIQIANLQREGTWLEGETVPGANDPQLMIELTTPLPEGGVVWPWGRGVWLVALAAMSGWLGWRRGFAGWLLAKARQAGESWAMMSRRTLWIGAVVVAIGEAWLLWPLHRTIDWPLWDEANYAAIGAAWARAGGGLGELHSAPVFVATYGVLSRLGDLASAIFAQHYFVKFGSTLLLYFVLARWWRSWIAAAAVALCWGATQFQTEFPLLVYQGAWLWFLAALVTVDRWPLAGLGFAALAMGGRQEYQFALAIGALWLGWRMWRLRSWRALLGQRKLVVGVGLTVVVWIGVAAVLMRTSFRHSGDRAWFAFQQHYAARAVATGEVTGIEPFIDFPRVMEKDFGRVHSLGEAWHANAGAVSRHVWYNLRQAPVELARLGEIHAGLDSAAGLLLVSALVALVAARRNPKQTGQPWPMSVVLAAATGLVIAPGLLVLAKGAYLLPLVPAVVGLLGWGMSRVRLGSGIAGLMSMALLAAGLVACVAAPRVFVPGARARTVAETVAVLESVWPAAGRPALVGVGASSYAHYLGDDRCEGIESLSEVTGVSGQSEPIGQLVQRRRPLAVLVTEDWRRSARFDADEIARACPAPEWTRREVPAGELYLRAR